jgi:hypothetical protein
MKTGTARTKHGYYAEAVRGLEEKITVLLVAADKEASLNQSLRFAEEVLQVRACSHSTSFYFILECLLSYYFILESEQQQMISWLNSSSMFLKPTTTAGSASS